MPVIFNKILTFLKWGFPVYWKGKNLRNNTFIKHLSFVINL